MANTTIQIKRSGTASASPAVLDYGELAINYADGKLFYKAANGSIYQLNTGSGSFNYFGTVNANNTLLVSDTAGDVLGVIAGNNITVVGDAVNDTFTVGLKDNVSILGTLNVGSDFTHSGGVFYINNGAGAGGSSEGGEIQLANATSATQILSGRVSIDIYENKLRFFETNSPNRGAFINIASALSGVGTDLLAAASAVDATARNTANGAFNKANAALANTSGVVFSGDLTVTSNVTADRFISLNNGNGENFKVGDDAWIGDTNLVNTVRIKGQQNSSIAYINFGPNDGRTLGRAGTGDLTWDGYTIFTANTDGAGSNLDADFLDGQHGAYYSNLANAAFNKANAALANTSGVIFNGQLHVPTLLAGNPTAGLARLRFVEDANISYIQSGTDALLTGRPIHFTPYYSAAATMVVDVANATVGINRTNPSSSYALDVVGTINASSLLINGSSPFASVNAYSDSLLVTARAYTNTSVTAANTYAGTVGTSANAYADTLLVTARAYTNTSTTAANTYAATVGTSANAYASGVGTNANTYAATVGTSANAYAGVMANSANAWANTKVSSSGGTITGNLSIVGDLYITGNSQFQNVTTLSVGDPLIYLAANNYATDTVDIGFVANYVNATGANVHTGLFRDYASKMYYLFQGYDKEPINNYIDPAGNNITLSVLNADVITSNLKLGGANAIVWLSSAYVNANAAYDKANAANLLAFNTGVGANAYASTVGTSANAYAATVGTSANAYSDTLLVTARAYTNTSVTAANTYAGTVGTSANAYASTVGTAANLYASGVGTSANAYASTVGTSANNFSGTMANASNTLASSAYTVANAAFAKANTSTSGGGGGYSGNNGEASGTGLGDIFRVHSNTLTQNVTIYSGNNATAVGPLTIQTGKKVTIQTGARMAIV